MKSQAEYREDNDECPVCGGVEIDWQQIYSDSGGASRQANCNECGVKWYENYALTGYTIVSPDTLETPDE